MRDLMRRWKRFVGRAIFFSRWVAPIGKIIGRPSKFTTNWRRRRTIRFNGGTRLFSKRAYAWKKKQTAQRRSPRFIEWSIAKRDRIGHTSCSGFTEPASTRRVSWKTRQSGNRRQRFTKNSRPRGACAVKKQKR